MNDAIAGWIVKSEENLTAAELCLEYGLRNASVNRAYYAMFQAAIAALTKFGIPRRGERWGHNYVQAQFSNALIQRRKVLPGRFKKALPDIMAHRHEADYSTTQISSKIANLTLRLAQSFVQQIQGVI